MNEKCVRMRCDCGCCAVEFTRTDWDDGEVSYDISVLDSRYDHNVNGLFGRLRRAFGVLVGKPVYFNDAFMREEEFVDLLGKLMALADEGGDAG